ncbi:MAG: carboxypeptidase regulatory-like domain-containing protein [Bacteroidaceae bacterium]|nr:carboxypeptidase regulatory-like domain-containing protein [Bacteroidaceae bacterium]
MPRRFITAVLLLSVLQLSLPALAQVEGGKLTGTVADAVTGKPVDDALVELLNADSLVIDSARSVHEERWEMDVLGKRRDRSVARYTLSIPSSASYLLRVSRTGYDTSLTAVTPTFTARHRTFDAGRTTLISSAHPLGEAVVTATRVKMYYNGDTLIYNASAFATERGDVLEDLLRQLPGAELRRGVIYVDGEPVSELLLGGKHFFRDNVATALQNLPAFTIDKLKVYRLDGDKSRLMGRDMGDRRLVMDVRLKKDYRRQWLARLEAGGGTQRRYTATGFAMHFDDLQAFSLTPAANNLNIDQHFGRNSYNASFYGSGLYRKKKLDANYEFEPSQDLSLSVAVTYGHDNAHHRTDTDTEQFLEGGNAYSQSLTERFSSTDNFVTLARLAFRPAKRFNATLTYLFNYERTHSNAHSLSANYSGQPLHSPTDAFNGWTDVTSRQRGNSQDLSHTRMHMLQFNGNAAFDPGILSLNGTLSVTSTSAAPTETSTVETALQSLTRTTRAPSEQHNLAFNTTVAYEHPLRSRPGRATTLSAEAALRFKRNTGETPFFIDGAPDDDNSHNDRTHSSSVRAAATANHSFRLFGHRWFRLNSTLTLDARSARLLQTRPGRRIAPSRQALFLLPRVELAWHPARDDRSGNKGALSLAWTLTHEFPQMLLLSDAIDRRDPLNIATGNPDLDDSHIHTLTLRANTHRENWQYEAEVSLAAARGAVGMAMRYDRATGIRTVRPENIPGTDLQTSLLHTLRFDLHNGHTFWLTANHTRHRSHELNQAADAPTPHTKRVVHTEHTLHANYLIFGRSSDLDLDLAYTESHTRGTRADFGSQRLHRLSFRGKTVLSRLPLRLRFDTDVDAAVYLGHLRSGLKRGQCQWSASLSRTFLHKSIEVSVRAHNILAARQTSLVTTSTARVETRTLALPRYVLFHFSYKFHALPKRRAPLRQ